MRALCDACESALAIVFCAADEAALCLSCDEKVHLCNKLASRHVRVGLATPKTFLAVIYVKMHLFPGDQPQPEDPAPQPMYQGRQEEDRIGHKRHQQERTDRITKFLQF